MFMFETAQEGFHIYKTTADCDFIGEMYTDLAEFKLYAEFDKELSEIE